MKLSVKFAWYDLWIGFYWDRKNRVLYFCPIPMLLFVFKARREVYWCVPCSVDQLFGPRKVEVPSKGPCPDCGAWWISAREPRIEKLDAVPAKGRVSLRQ